MDKSPPIDAVDRILAQWQRERPDLDCSPMGPIGRLKRCAMLLEPQVEVAFTRHDLVRWEFDMLATLRRAGAPFVLSPTQLFSTLMITSGTMTHRLKALEKRGFITRLPNPEDARSMLVALTSAGRERIDAAVETHVDNERQLLAGLSDGERQQLDQALRVLMRLLETGYKVAVGADRHHGEKQSHGKEDQRQTAEDLHQRNQPGPRAVIRGQSFDRPMARIVNQ